MALSATQILEVRGGAGSDTNSGGFKAGASGTDWSQQNAAQYSVTDGVTAGTTTITSATANFGTDVVGNLIYVAGGTGSVVAGWYEITARTNSTTITVDRSTGLTAGTGVTLNIGGAFNTIAAAVAIMTVSGMQCYVKASATYSISAAIALSAAGSSTVLNRLIGYSSSRSDLGRPVIQTAAAVNGVTVSANGWSIENLDLDGNSTGLIGIGSSSSPSYTGVHNCICRGWTAEGIKLTGGSNYHVQQCEVKTCAGTTGSVHVDGSGIVEDCWVHDNTKCGIVDGTNRLSIVRNRCTNNSGASSDGIQCNQPLDVSNNTCYGNGRDGIRILNNNAALIGVMKNNILMNNGGKGINQATSPSPQNGTPFIHHNAFKSNTGGALSGVNAGVGDVTLTVDPFTAAASDDYTLNNTAGGGAACRAAGYPAYLDIGAVQHRDPLEPQNLLIASIGTY